MEATVDIEAFVRGHTVVASPPVVPELRLHLAPPESDAIELWQALERATGRPNLPPPYWAYAWAGGQALARHVLDHPEVVANRRVLDFAAGGSLLGLASLRAGAASVLAADIDPFAEVATRLNAALNGLAVPFTSDDLVGTDAGWDVVLAGDVCYERPMAELVVPWLRALAVRGAQVLLGDPGRAYLPKVGLVPLSRCRVPVSRALESCDVRDTGVFRLVPA